MLVGINYSPIAARLWNNGRIEPDIWKIAPMPEHWVGSAGRRVCVHFPFMADDVGFLNADWTGVEEALVETDTRFVNTHLDAKRANFPVDSSDDAVIERFLRHLSVLGDEFGPERIIAENVVYRGASGPYLEASVRPELIREVLEVAGAGLLLDTAHARLTANELGVDAIDYIRQLPTHRLKELHITGILHDGTKERDSMPMTDEDWRVAGFVLDQIAAGAWPMPWICVLEYGGTGPLFDLRSDPDVIERDLTRLIEEVDRRGLRG